MAEHDKIATRVIHAGQRPDPSTGAIMTPIYTTSTYVQASPGEHLGYEYSRTHNPTRKAWEACIADLEGGAAGFAFASGMAAADSILHLLSPGDHVLAMNDLYGGTWRLFERVRRRSSGLEFSFVDLSDLDTARAAITPRTRMIWVETPTNPMLNRSRWAPTSCCTRSPSTSTAIPIWSAAPWSHGPTSWPNESVSFRIQPAAYRRHSIRFW